MKKTIVYIDGFNFYYSCLKNSPYKWLDLSNLFKNIVDPAVNDIVKIKYFTAKITARKNDPQGPIRQNTYLRALERNSDIDIIYGSFQMHKKKAFLANGKGKVDIIHTEEKGSDVNLCVHMLNDAWLNEYDCALLVSNDSDMCEALRLVKKLDKTIGWVRFDGNIKSLAPSHHPSVQLNKLVDFRKFIKEKDLKNAQLPQKIPGTNISKPSSW